MTVEQHVRTVAAAVHDTDDVVPTWRHRLKDHLVEAIQLAHLGVEPLAERPLIGDLARELRDALGERYQARRVHVLGDRLKEVRVLLRHRSQSLPG